MFSGSDIIITKMSFRNLSQILDVWSSEALFLQ